MRHTLFPLTLLAAGLALGAQTAPPPTRAQLDAICARGQDLAQRMRFEDACRIYLDHTGIPSRTLASPLMIQDKERWTAWFLGPEDASGKRPLLKTLTCPPGKTEALAPVENLPLPASLEAQAELLGGALHQLGSRGGDTYLVAVPEPGGGASLYRLPRRDATGAARMGQDFRLTRGGAGAGAPFVFTRFHRTLFTLNQASLTGVPKGAKGVSMMHTHLDLADPCETDVAGAILGGDLSVTVIGADGVYTCATDGTVGPGPKSDKLPQADAKGGPAPGETLTGLRAFALDQSALEFENAWVAAPAETPGTYTFCCVYLDPAAGFKARVGGQFTLDKDGRAKVVPPPAGQGAALPTLTLERDFPAALLPQGIVKDLGLEPSPSFLAAYRPAVKVPEDTVKRGAALNHIGESERALRVLGPLYEARPDMKGLAFELAFAHNALNQSDKALTILQAAATREPKDPWIARELAFTHLHLAHYTEAVAAYLRSLPLVAEDDMRERSEQAMNLAHAYQQLKDNANREAWLAKAKAWAPKGTPLADYFAKQDAATRK